MSEQVSSEPWPMAARPSDLPDDELHVWSASLAIDSGLEHRLERWLSADEQARADRFHFPRDRARFIACRGRLREMLSAYAGVPPEEIAFHYGSHGKPFLAAPAGQAPIYFNVSHAGDLAVLAFRRRGEVGVDVERLRTVHEAESIARRYFTDRESATLQELSADQRMEAFFRAWTRKEALLKAIGVGLSFSLNEVEVTLRPDEPAALLHLPPTGADPGPWGIVHLSPAPGFIGALAAPRLVEGVVSRRWDG